MELRVVRIKALEALIVRNMEAQSKRSIVYGLRRQSGAATALLNGQ
jgi:hypothetical protein